MVVVCHVAVLRCIHAYFTGVMLPALPFTDLLPHTVYELTPGERALAIARESFRPLTHLLSRPLWLLLHGGQSRLAFGRGRCGGAALGGAVIAGLV